MKIKLDPELSYIIGFWRKRKTKEGIGIYGEDNDIEIFSKEILNKKIVTPEKLLTEDNKIYFYHTAYRKFFKDIEFEQCERFKYLNDYAASYLAGMFDSVGAFDSKTGIIYFEKAGKNDDLLLLGLGFGGKWRDKKLVIGRPLMFLRFIKNYVKKYKDHEIFSYAEKKK